MLALLKVMILAAVEMVIKIWKTLFLFVDM